MKMDEIPYKILVVEDNEGDYILVEDYLREHFLRADLTHVTCFKEGKELLSEAHAAFDVLLLDLSLPDISKETLIKEAEAFSQTVPVIFLTGYTDLDFAVKSLSLGVSDYLVKDVITPLVLYKSIIYSLERFRFIKSLRDSEKRYIDLFHLSPAPMWVYDVSTPAFLNVNEAAPRHYGYSKEEFLSMRLSDLSPQEAPNLAETTLNHAMEDTPPIYQNTLIHVKKDKTIIYVEKRSNRIKFKGSQAEVVLATDITEKLLQLRAIEDQNNRLKEITWKQSHVVRAPVARLKGLVDLLKHANLTGSEQDKLLGHIMTSADEIDQVIRDIVNMSQTMGDNDRNKK